MLSDSTGRGGRTASGGGTRVRPATCCSPTRCRAELGHVECSPTAPRHVDEAMAAARGNAGGGDGNRRPRRRHERTGSASCSRCGGRSRRVGRQVAAGNEGMREAGSGSSKPQPDRRSWHSSRSGRAHHAAAEQALRDGHRRGLDRLGNRRATAERRQLMLADLLADRGAARGGGAAGALQVRETRERRRPGRRHRCRFPAGVPRCTSPRSSIDAGRELSATARSQLAATIDMYESNGAGHTSGMLARSRSPASALEAREAAAAALARSTRPRATSPATAWRASRRLAVRVDRRQARMAAAKRGARARPG